MIWHDKVQAAIYLMEDDGEWPSPEFEPQPQATRANAMQRAIKNLAEAILALGEDKRKEIMKAESHEMEKRIRFGSDGNGVFVVVSPDRGRTWRLIDDERHFSPVDLGFLLEDEFLAGIKFLRCEWSPGQPMPRVKHG